MFPRIYFDKDKTERLVECLKRYRRHITKSTETPGAPLHDEYSHGADMLRYLCVNADKFANADNSISQFIPKRTGPIYRVARLRGR
jgi:phage terminase large subunit